ncbi:hypothetical protein F5I97DRAFT_1864642 [Phlebopus sp. FC_14]|nr:hypothetical protein F5I97DRAFT_1864642 [Phlebopus sp. FC_14]
MASGTPPAALEQAFTGSDPLNANPDEVQDPQNSEKEALESHEVIELQAFSERKAWIEEKIKFLKRLPPVEVFTGIDVLRTSAESIPGLPTREQLQEWLAEHDKIEKETEIFDSGELKKLRKFTKAATQRHLSSEDTDLIELTLTTIYELDKLLHLLRDRSENLDLLGIRLTWEEHRRGAWADLRKVSGDIEDFLTTRARWSPSIYEMTGMVEEKRSARRGSIASMASDTSATSNAGFSRSARFKLAELLSRDAAQFSGKISSLRHGKIAGAGKALDKLIDNSRKPVPEALLDEQDRLEEKGIHEVEDVGKFVMNVVMQWRKADELYVETMKDQSTAQTLLEEIETAKLHHPTPRQSSSFTSRADTLVKRLALRGDPMSNSELFPQPTHALFPEQESINASLIQTLSTEFSLTADVVSRVDSLSWEYRSSYEAVKNVDALSQTACKMMPVFNSIIDRFSTGITDCDGDGSPPNITTEDCLQPTAHAAFLTLFPSMLQEADQANAAADGLIHSYQLALHDLDRPGIDLAFCQNAAQCFDAIVSSRDRMVSIIDDTNTRVGCLRLARKIWSTMDCSLKELRNIQNNVGELIEKERWTQQTDSCTEPLTPETPQATLLILMSSPDLFDDLSKMQRTLARDVEIPLALLSSEKLLHTFLAETADHLMDRLESVKQMIQLLDAVRSQSSAMALLQEEVNGLMVRIEDLKIRYDATIEDILLGTMSDERVSEMQSGLHAEADALQKSAGTFTDNVMQRVPFVSCGPRIALHPSCESLSDDIRLRNCDATTDELAFTLTSLNDIVRADSNLHVMRLAGEMGGLERKANHFQLARLAKTADAAILSATNELRVVSQELESLRSTFSSVWESDEKLEQLRILFEKVEHHSSKHRPHLSRSIALIRESFREMEVMPASRDLHIHDTLLVSRQRAADDLELRTKSWGDRVASLREELAATLLLESRRVETLRIQQEMEMEERRQRDEQERFAALAKAREERPVPEEAEKPARGILAHPEAERQTRDQEKPQGQEVLRGPAMNSPQEAQEPKRGVRTKAEGDYFRDLKSEVQQRQGECRWQCESEEKPPKRTQKKGWPVSPIPAASSRPDEDVFGLRVAPSPSPTKNQAKDELLDRIVMLRKRLRSININEVARPPAAPASSSAQLPTLEHYGKMNAQFASVLSAFAALPSSTLRPTTDLELRSLKIEVEASAELMQRIRQLADLADAVHKCDAALSDLLEHIDSYPSTPVGPLSSTHTSTHHLPSEEQLRARIGFTRRAVGQVTTYLHSVKDDPRATAEHHRIQQTWAELEEMGNDHITGKKLRSSSVLSSGRNSSASASGLSSHSGAGTPSISSGVHGRKASGYSGLSVRGSTSRGRFLSPGHPSSKRSVSGRSDSHRRPSSKLSVLPVDSSRSFSGPLASTTPISSSSLYSSTFASRQRTASLSTSVCSPTTRPASTMRPRAQTRTRASPTPSDVSVNSRANQPRSSSSLSTWSRAPRQSFPISNRRETPPRKTQPNVKKAYVADPKNKLDVAVGDVVNKLPVNINVEVVADTWKDQSGKYWIGDQEPKLCFCRILRSQTVMVRVGGGWQELSKFIKDHFADMFRIMPPESPQRFSSPRAGPREEKWISSATLFEAPEIITSPPRTPEPHGSFLPSFTLSTPDAHSPHSVKSTPSSGSPLAPLQFMRRADLDALPIRPVTPSKPAMHRPRTSISSAPARHTVWRP